jgi:hypothetical protein
MELTIVVVGVLLLMYLAAFRFTRLLGQKAALEMKVAMLEQIISEQRGVELSLHKQIEGLRVGLVALRADLTPPGGAT